MNIEMLKGKKMSNFITKKTQIPDKNDFINEFDITKQEIRKPYIEYNTTDICIVSTIDDYVLVFINDELDCVVLVYEIHSIHFNPIQRHLIITGHEMNHIYYLDNKEYSKYYTR